MTTPIPLDTPISELRLGVTTAMPQYKPFTYPWAEAAETMQQNVHWLEREIPMGEDLKDWNAKEGRLTDSEKALLLNIQRLFTQSDIDVNNNYLDNFIPIFRNGEIRRMMTVFAAFETIHVRAYSHVIESLKLPPSTYHEFMEIEEMRAKHDHLISYQPKTLKELLLTVAIFSSFVEGLQLFASFAMLFNFQRFGLMKGLGQIVSWSIRDETIHVEAMQALYHTMLAESGHTPETLREELVESVRVFVKMEDAFIDKAFEFGESRGIDAASTKRYIRYIADWRLEQLGLEPIYNIEKNPFPWMNDQTGHEHANFFETRPTEYSKGAQTGTWDEAWDSLEETQLAEEKLDPAANIHAMRIEQGIAEELLV